MSMDSEHSGEGHEDHLLVAEFALGLLDAPTHEQMARRIAAEPELARELRLWQARLSSLDGQFAEARPPRDLLHRIEARLFAGPMRSASDGFWQNLGFWRGATAACLMLAVIATGVNFVPRPLPKGQELVAALQAQNSDVKFMAIYDARSGLMKIAVMAGNVPDKDFQLWAIKGSAAPVSMGLLPVSGPAQMTLPAGLQKSVATGTVLAVSLEPKGGSPTGLPTGPIVAKGATAQI